MRRVLILLLLVPLLISCGMDPNLNGGNDTVYEDSADWMGRLPSGTLIRNITMPGTHDSCANYDYLGLSSISSTQDLKLMDQLEAGVRCLDIRITEKDGVYGVYHGPVYMKMSLDDVAKVCKDFLGKHPTEFILMFVQYENGYPETIAAFYNNGGIRTSLLIAEGETQKTVIAADVYTINPFCNYWYIYEVTAPELAEQLADAIVDGNLGNEMSGITYTYTYTQTESIDERSGKARTKTKVESIDSITLADGTALDLADTTTKYLVCISNYSATLEGSVFIGKTPLNENSAPIDNETLIAQLLKEAGEGKEIAVDTSARGTGTLKAE